MECSAAMCAAVKKKKRLRKHAMNLYRNIYYID